MKWTSRLQARGTKRRQKEAISSSVAGESRTTLYVLRHSEKAVIISLLPRSRPRQTLVLPMGVHLCEGFRRVSPRCAHASKLSSWHASIASNGTTSRPSLLGALVPARQLMSASALVDCAQKCDLSGLAAQAALCLQTCSARFSHNRPVPATNGAEDPAGLSLTVSVFLAVLLVGCGCHAVTGNPPS